MNNSLIRISIISINTRNMIICCFSCCYYYYYYRSAALPGSCDLQPKFRAVVLGVGFARLLGLEI